MNTNLKRIIPAVLCFVLLISSALQATALQTGDSYLYDDWGRSLPAPTPYIAVAELGGEDFHSSPLNAPKDMFVSAANNIYIADTENNRIVVLNENFEMIREIDEVFSPDERNTLNKPEGVFVDGAETVYICDTGNGRVIALNGANEVTRLITRPQTELMGEKDEFRPVKAAADSAGYVYVACYGLYQGLACYNERDEFSSFFGSNKVELTLSTMATYYWKQIFSKAQAESMTRLIPAEYSNLFIDKENFIYTSTVSTESSLQEIKKLNAAGVNVLHISGYNTAFAKDDYGDIEKEWVKGRFEDSKMVDVNVDGDGVIAALDSSRGRIFGYDGESNLLFVFGNIGDRTGEFFTPVALEKAGENYLVLDSTKNTVTVFSPTGYMNDVRAATVLYSQGRYIDSMDLWQNILKYNSNFQLAYRSIGRAYLQQHDYKTAMQYLKKGNDRRQYSLALTGYRKQFLTNYFLYIAGAVVLLYFVCKYLYRKLRKKLGLPVKKKKTIYR